MTSFNITEKWRIFPEPNGAGNHFYRERGNVPINFPPVAYCLFTERKQKRIGRKDDGKIKIQINQQSPRSETNAQRLPPSDPLNFISHSTLPLN